MGGRRAISFKVKYVTHRVFSTGQGCQEERTVNGYLASDEWGQPKSQAVLETDARGNPDPEGDGTTSPGELETARGNLLPKASRYLSKSGRMYD